MSFELNAVFSLTIGIGAITGWIRYRKTDPAFIPFILLLSAGFLNEVISILVVRAGYTNTVYYNVFSLAEGLFITWQFRKWKLFEKKTCIFYLLTGALTALWLAESLMRNILQLYNSIFIISFSVLTITMSIHMINRLIFREPVRLYHNSAFLVCLGWLIYFTYSVLVETFWLYGLNQGRFFRIRIYEILAYINLFTNLVFVLAAIWMPLRRQYILQS
jgi:hypothetical protein